MKQTRIWNEWTEERKNENENENENEDGEMRGCLRFRWREWTESGESSVLGRNVELDWS